MPNYVDNAFTIQSNDQDIMLKIEELIFKRDKNGQLSFTMEKLLPLPKEFSDMEGYNKYGYYWCNIMWGTKWDVIDPHTVKSGNTLALYYETAWGPNTEWAEKLCSFINWFLLLKDDRKELDIRICHNYSSVEGDFGGILEWSPGDKFKYKEYDLIEYCYLYDRDFHDSLVTNFGYEPFNPKMAKYRDFIETHVDESFLQ